MEYINFDDEHFYQVARKVKTAGIAVMWLLVLAGLSGAFGYGPFTRIKTGDASITIEHEYFLRIKRKTPLKVIVQRIDPSDSLLQISISRTYTDKVQLLEIIPKPLKVVLDDESSIYFFEVAPGTSAPQTITYYTTAYKFGQCLFSVTSGAHTFSLSQFIYP